MSQQRWKVREAVDEDGDRPMGRTDVVVGQSTAPSIFKPEPETFPLGPVHIAGIGGASPPPPKRPIPRRAPQLQQRKRPQGPQPCSTSSQSEEHHNLDVSSSSDGSSMTAINQKQKQPPRAHHGRPLHHPPPPRQSPLPVPGQVLITQGGQQRPRANTPSMKSSLSAVCDDTCDCALLTGSELENDVELGGKRILVADLKHFFRRAVDGTWTCKKCA